MAIKNAREMALLPYASRVTQQRGGRERRRRARRPPRARPRPAGARHRADAPRRRTSIADELDGDERRAVEDAGTEDVVDETVGATEDESDEGHPARRRRRASARRATSSTWPTATPATTSLPKGLAIKATAGRRGPGRRPCAAPATSSDAADRAAAEEVATRARAARSITITARAGAEGKLFGSVTAADVAEAVAGPDRRRARPPRSSTSTSRSRTLGTHQVPAKLHAEVEFPITVEVVAA